MTVSGFEVIWILLTAACLFGGVALTLRGQRGEEVRVEEKGKEQEKQQEKQQQKGEGRCPKCRGLLDRGAAFCGTCGYRLIGAIHPTVQAHRRVRE